jgi:hypothetical protein
MKFRLIEPGGAEWRLDTLGSEPADHELVGAWLHRIFAAMQGAPIYNPVEYRLIVS